MKKNLLISFTICASMLFCSLSQAQVTIGALTTPDGNALLDLKNNPKGDGTADKGVLLPRVALESTASKQPITTALGSIAVGMTVFNTATTNDVTQGYYYWNGTKWVRLIDNIAPDDTAWKLAGNANATATSFIGTSATNADVDLFFKRHGDQAGWLNNDKAATAFGVNALPATANTGINNSAFGNKSLAANTIGSSNNAFGTMTLNANTEGIQNSAFGNNALSKNVGVGLSTNQHNVTYVQNGSHNSAFGYNTLKENIYGNLNSAFGAYALQSNIGSAATNVGNNNNAFGAYALEKNKTGFQNNAFGIDALQENKNGFGNSAFGNGALNNNDKSGIGNVFGNNAFGNYSLQSNETGTENSAFGTTAMKSNKFGSYNSAFGNNALQNFAGTAASGSYNNGFGRNAGGGYNNGSRNIFLGAWAGYASPANYTGSGNILIGTVEGLIITTSPAASNEMNIGNLLFGTGVNAGNNLGDNADGKIGINTNVPTETFHTNGTARIGELPKVGDNIYTINDNTAANGTASATGKDQPFVPASGIVADANGVLGRTAGFITPLFVNTETFNQPPTNTLKTLVPAGIGLLPDAAGGVIIPAGFLKAGDRIKFYMAASFDNHTVTSTTANIFYEVAFGGASAMSSQITNINSGAPLGVDVEGVITVFSDGASGTGSISFKTVAPNGSSAASNIGKGSELVTQSISINTTTDNTFDVRMNNSTNVTPNTPAGPATPVATTTYSFSVDLLRILGN
jgi:hypothetical protein